MGRVLKRQLLITFVPTGLLLAALGMLAFGYGKDIGQLLREPTTAAGLHPLTGAVSNLGILLWAAPAAISLFAGAIARSNNGGDAAGFLLASGGLSAFLCCDDFFQIHEDLMDRYFGIDEKVVYGALGIAVLTYLVRYRRLILSTHCSMLILAILLLGTSVAIDAVLEQWMHSLGHGRILIEDGAKLLGIAAWCSYYVRTSYDLVHPILTPNRLRAVESHTSAVAQW